MSRNRVLAATPSDDDDLDHVMRLLAAQPRPARNAFVAFYLWWNELDVDTRVGLIHAARPGLKREDVAKLAGISSRRLSDRATYQRCKPSPKDYSHIGRRPSKWRRVAGGGWRKLDDPDRGGD